MTIVVNIIGITLIIFTLWWFLLSKPRTPRLTAESNVIAVRVKDGVYAPSRIAAPAHTALVLRFTREDPTPCAGTVIFTGIHRHYSLPLNQVVVVKLDPQPVGELEFTCEMGLYRGKVVIE